MAFSFNISAESAVRNTRRQLAPWNIYDVKFIGCEFAEGTNKEDPSKSWKRLDVKFENEDGYFNIPLWYPKDSDGDRRTTTGKNGNTIAFASNFEVLMANVAQIAQVLNPTGFTKMQAASVRFKSFDDVARALVQILDKVKGTETKIKLIGSNYNGKVTTKIPTIVSIRNSGKVDNTPIEEIAIEDRPSYISDNFIGDKLFFSDYEEGERQKYLNAKPTEIKSEASIVDTAGVDAAPEDDFDLGSLLP